MIGERFRSGLIIRELISSETAARFARAAQAIRFIRPELVMAPAINEQDVAVRVLKLWLEDRSDPTRTTFAHALDDADTDNRLLDALASFTALADAVDEGLGRKSWGRFLQAYMPKGVLMPHNDKGTPSGILQLSGGKEFRLHDSETREIIERVETGPGDVFYFNGVGLHSAANLSRDDFCETIVTVYSEDPGL